MKSTKPYFKQQRNTDSHDRRKVPPKAKPTAAHTKEVPGTKADPELSDIRTTARDYSNPMDYQHPYPCMKRLAELLALQYDANRTRHAYYRQVRLIHEHFGCDPANLTEAQLREYFLFVKLTKHWKPKTIRQGVAATRMCFERSADIPLRSGRLPVNHGASPRQGPRHSCRFNTRSSIAPEPPDTLDQRPVKRRERRAPELSPPCPNQAA